MARSGSEQEMWFAVGRVCSPRDLHACKAAVFFQLRLSDDRFLSIPTIPLDKIPI